VSRSWRERLLVWLAPGEISWVRLGRGLKRPVLDKRAVEVDPTYGPEPWQGAFAALRAEAEVWRKDPVSITVVLSNHFVRYMLVPQSDGVSGADEEHALAQFHFAKVHGERARAWDVRLAQAGAGAPRVACAIDAGLLEGLRACFPREGRPQLVSVQPYLMSAFNCWRRQFPGTGAWLLLVEAERACLALVADGRWATVCNVRGSHDHPDEWMDLLGRERWRVNPEQVPDTVLVHTLRPAHAPLPREGNWTPLVTDTFWPSGISLPEVSRYSAALTAS
jgi:hypothetical protein